MGILALSASAHPLRRNATPSSCAKDNVMSTKYSILPPPQTAILNDLNLCASLGFALYGGTSIALQLGHRKSVDFDFFTSNAIDRNAIRQSVPALKNAVILQDEIDTWTVQVFPLGQNERPVKLSFFGNLNFGRVGKPRYTDKRELLLASLDDLLGHKLKVLLQQVELKDYQDIAALIRAGCRLERGLGAAASLFPNMFPPAEAMRALTYFEGGDLKLLSKNDKATLTHAVSSTGPLETMPIIARNLTSNENDDDDDNPGDGKPTKGRLQPKKKSRGSGWER